MRSHAGCLLLLLAAIVIVQPAAVAGETLKAKDLERLIKSLSSLASETAFFADQLTQQHLTSHYAATHLDKLKDQLDEFRQELAKPAPAELESKQREAVQMSHAIATDLDTLGHAPQDEAALAKAKTEAERVHRALDKLKGQGTDMNTP